MKSFWKTYLALALVVGMGTYWYFVDSKKKSTAETENAKEKVFTVEKEKVKELGVAKSEGDPVRLVKEGSDWKLTSPAPAPADGAQVDSILSTIQTAEINRVVTEQPE